MSLGSNNSNFGYANLNPYGSNVNPVFVNKWSSNNPATFGSNEVPGLPGLAGAKNSVDAAAGIVPGIAIYKGGYKKLKRKIKNITKRYKRNMKGGKKYMRSIKSKIKAKYAYAVSRSRSRPSCRDRTRSMSRMSAGARRKRSRRRRKQRGGYSQYQNNLPMTPTYSVGGVLRASQVGLANPPPIKVLSNCVNCTDNYNHFTGKGFPSPGH
jgi:hypothetical protein